MEILIEELLPQVNFKTSRSGGKGGQNVNKVATKVELNFNFENSNLFSGQQKGLIREKLAGKIVSGNRIQVVCEEERSQYANKQRCLEKLCAWLKHALHIQKARKATKPKRSAVENRLKEKQFQALKKMNRRKDYL